MVLWLLTIDVRTLTKSIRQALYYTNPQIKKPIPANEIRILPIHNDFFLVKIEIAEMAIAI